MSSYSSLSFSYDEFTGDVNYSAYADLYQRIFKKKNINVETALDLCCGTGTLSSIMAGRGIDIVAVDGSSDMLSKAYSKYYDKGIQFVCQRAEELDLFGTVDAAWSSLDSFNYFSQASFKLVIEKLRLFIRPGGILIFDIRPEEFLRSLDGQIFVDESDDKLCLWRAELEESPERIVYGMDIFTYINGLWRRDQEEHTEYIHSEAFVRDTLSYYGFEDIDFFIEESDIGADRLFVSAIRNG